MASVNLLRLRRQEDLGATPRRSQPLPGPVTRTERIATIDILRGIALLWILFSNMDIFSGPETFFELPQGLPDTTFMNAHLHLNLLLLFFKWITTEGKARFLFSMHNLTLVIVGLKDEVRGLIAQIIGQFHSETVSDSASLRISQGTTWHARVFRPSFTRHVQGGACRRCAPGVRMGRV
jgi:hypothetical protein